MRETRTSGLMSGDGKRGDANLAQATAPVLDSTQAGCERDLVLAKVVLVGGAAGAMIGAGCCG
jgi:hypothetical protein